MGLFVNGFKRPRRISDFYIPPFWGDGSDGILTTGATYQAGVDFDKYSGFCIKQFSSINWDPATLETLAVDEPCRGLVLFVDGDVNIGEYATISMAKMGSVMPASPSELIDLYGDSTQMRHIVDTLKTLQGGAGGDGGDGGKYGGDGGTGGVGRICQGGIGGGGGGGTNYSSYHGGNGGSVAYPEVLPGCGGHVRTLTSGFNGGGGGGNGYFSEIEKWHGPGGRAYGAGGGGGAGSLGTNATNGEHTGGFILIIAKGTVTIAGTIDVTGGKGGNGGTGGSCPAGGGGGAGGGVIAVFAKGYIDTSLATKTLTGGAGGSGYQSGTAGGDGTYYKERI